MKVHGVSLSPFVRKVLMGLEYKGVEYEQLPVFPGDTSEAFSAISPLNKVPVLEDDGFTVPDSSVILRYLDARIPEPSLYPADPQLLATVCWLEEFSDTALIEACAGLFRERLLAPNMFNRDTDQALVDEILTERMPRVLGYLEGVANAEGYFVGDSLSVADIGITSALLTARYGDFVPDASEYPKVSAYLERALSAPLVQARLADEQQMIEGMT